MRLPWHGLVAFALVSATCSDARPNRLVADGVVGRRVATPEPPVSPDGLAVEPGDFVLQSDTLRLVVGGLVRPVSDRGAVLEARLFDTPVDDGLERWRFGLQVAGRWVRIVVHDLFLVERLGRPVIRIEASGQVHGREVHVDRELDLSPVDGVVAVHTTIWVDGRTPLEEARILERVEWNGAVPFVPGAGEIADEEVRRVPWMARDGQASAVVLGYEDGMMHVRQRFERHGAARLPGLTRAVSPKGPVARREPLRLRAWLSLAHGGVSDALRRMGWARGRPYPEVAVYLPYAPRGTLVRLYGADDVVLLRGRPGSAGQLVMPLPEAPPGGRATAPASVQVGATAWGHAASPRAPVEAGGRVVLRIPRGGRVHVVVRDAAGHRVPGRIRFESLDVPKRRIELGPDYAAAGALDTAITVDGDVVLPIPPGRYQVRVSRGPEYSLFEAPIEVTETFQPQISARLERTVDPGGWVGADLHLHSSPSPDSRVTLKDRVAALAAEGVRFAVPTDHNHVTSLADAVAELGVLDFGTVPGVEVTTDSPAFGHFNAYPYPRDPSQPGSGAPPFVALTPDALFAQLHAAPSSVLVQVNHPRLEPNIGYFDLLGYDSSSGSARDGWSDRYDVLEVWNGFDLGRPEKVERVFHDWLRILARGQRVVGVGNSDSHTIRTQWAGYPRTWVYAPGGPSNADDVLEGLRAGRAFVSNGPFVEATIDGKGPGEVAVAEGGAVKVKIRVRAAPWIDVSSLEVWVGTTLAYGDAVVAIPTRRAPRRVARPLPAVRVEREIALPVEGDTFVVVRARGAQSMDAYFGRGGVLPMAFTNPIFVDGDGDGQVVWFPPPPPSVDAGAVDGGLRHGDASVPSP